MKQKVCFVCQGGYPLISTNENLKYVGGAELMQLLIGKEIVKKRFDISFIIYDEEGETKPEFKKINIIKTYPFERNINFLNKIRFIWKALKEANSDIYIQAGGVIAVVAIFCFIKKRKYIKWVASDKNVVLEGLDRKTPFFLKIGHYIDIKLAKQVIAQNEFQKQIVKNKFKKNCIKIKNPIDIPNKNIEFMKKNEEKNVLWVGTIRSIKQPKLYLKLARMLPKYNFKIIGGRADTEPKLYDKICEEVKDIPNVEFFGFIPYDRMHEYYKKASVLVNTSEAEGFPNIFLEAWINYVPVVSLNVDPDEVICNNKLGFHSKTFKQMISDLDLLLNNYNIRKQMGENGRKYVEENHDLKKIANQFEKLIISLE